LCLTITDSTTPWEPLWSHDFWGKPLAEFDSHKSYRPVSILSFRVNHWLAGSYDAWSFHLTNIVLHILVSVLIYALSFELIFPERYFCAVGSALLFAVHPVHTEAVTGLVGRAELLCALFGLVAVLCYHRARSRQHSWVALLGWLGVATVAYVLSLLPATSS
jgi:hypothetical protein